MKKHHTIIRAILPALLAGGTLLATSCQSTTAKNPKKTNAVAISSALTTGHWTKVRNNPPTYFPKGTPPDQPTGYMEGSWVLSGDTKGTKFFIPVEATSIPRQQLLAEARASMTPEARMEQARNNRKSDAKEARGKLVSRTAVGLLGIMAEVARIQNNHRYHDHL